MDTVVFVEPVEHCRQWQEKLLRVKKILFYTSCRMQFCMNEPNFGKCHAWIFTPWSRVLLEKLRGPQLVKRFPAFYGTWRFITEFTNSRHLSLSWASSIQSMPSHPTSWWFILIFVLPTTPGSSWVSLPQISPTEPRIHLSSPPYVLHAPPISFFSTWSPEQYSCMDIFFKKKKHYFIQSRN